MRSSEVNFDHFGVRLHFVERALGEHGTLVKHRDLLGDLPYEVHVVLHDDDGAFAGE
jgi:hypothetical protein